MILFVTISRTEVTWNKNRVFLGTLTLIQQVQTTNRVLLYLTGLVFEIFLNLTPNCDAIGRHEIYEFFSSLLLLMKFCLVCDLPAVIQKVHTKGTALCVKLFCESGQNSYWLSQPKVKDTFMGNILTVASIIFGGGNYIQFNSVCNILKHFLSSTQFYALQKKYVFPAINKIYKKYRNRLFDESKARETVEVSGDGRCDTPGYNAK